MYLINSKEIIGAIIYMQQNSMACRHLIHTIMPHTTLLIQALQHMEVQFTQQPFQTSNC